MDARGGEDPAGAGPETRERPAGLSPAALDCVRFAHHQAGCGRNDRGAMRGLGGEPQSYLLSGPQIEKARTFNGSGFFFRRAKAPKAGVLSRVPVIGGACAHFTRPEECRGLVYTKRCLHTQYFSGSIRQAAYASWRWHALHGCRRCCAAHSPCSACVHARTRPPSPAGPCLIRSSICMREPRPHQYHRMDRTGRAASGPTNARRPSDIA